jgi:glycosyltransferase involved in cell wall biosynthesis
MDSDRHGSRFSASRENTNRMASVLLPTHRWTPACDEIVAQLPPDDELLLICDHSDDPIATDKRASAAGTNVTVLVAGEPVGCSGKANAIATGLEHASHDRLIWTDDDFRHGDDWLATMKNLGEQYGAVSGIPVFISDEWPWLLFEPAAAIFGSLQFYTRNRPWAGSLTFNQDQLDIDQLVTDLRRTLSDDVVLQDHLDTLVTTRNVVYQIPIAGSTCQALNRMVRFTKTIFHFSPEEIVAFGGFSLAFVGMSLYLPWLGAIVSTAIAAATYRFLGVSRSTYLLAFPAFLIAPLILAYSLAKREFTWAGRRYRWEEKFDVDVVSTPAEE